MVNPHDVERRLKAAGDIFSESTTTIAKLRSVHTLLAGIHPDIDKRLAGYHRCLSALEQVAEGEFVELAASEALPENTEKEKKRKAALLLLLKSWKELKAEVARVEQEMEHARQSGSGGASMWGKIFRVTKGPLALITIIAIGVAALKVTSVDIVVQNQGCSTLQATSKIPISIPGLSLPNQDIPSGGSATITIPPLAMHVDGTQNGALKINALSFDLSFDLSGVKDVTFNGASLIGAETSIHLSKQPKHELILSCG